MGAGRKISPLRAGSAGGKDAAGFTGSQKGARLVPGASQPVCIGAGLKLGSDALSDGGMRVWPLDHPAPAPGAGGVVGGAGQEVALGEAGLRREGVWCPLLGQAFKSTLALRRNKQLIDPSA